MTTLPAHLSDDDLRRLAHRHVQAQLSWYLHAAVFVGVNLLLGTWPALGWGLGLLLHGLLAFFGPNSRYYHRLLHNEHQRLLAQRDPW